MASVVGDFVATSADPEGVRTALDRLADRRSVLEDDDALARAAIAVMAASDSLREFVVADDASFAVLADLSRPVAIDGSSVERLVRTRRLEFLRIAARSLVDGQTITRAEFATEPAHGPTSQFDDVVDDLSQLATTLLGDALALAAPDEPSGDRLAIVAMGKLAGRELNFVSDVDVMFVGEGDPVALDRWAQQTMAIAGRCCRIDADLRPEGRDGKLVRTVEGYRSYWERWARPWEFQALLKSRAAVGSIDLRRAFAAASEDALWSYDFDRDALDEIRRIKRRSESDVVRRGLADVDVKRGLGGLRDIEFSVQLLQLVHGAADPLLRSPSTRRALSELASGGYVDPSEAETLDGAYVHLRRVEHAVQVLHERQTHAVPADRDVRRRLARTLGYRGSADSGPTEAFDDELAMRRLAVRRVHQTWYFRPLLDAFAGHHGPDREVSDQRLRSFGFADADRTRQAVAELTRGLTRSSRMMAQVLPLVFGWLSQTPDPDRGLLALRRLATDPRRSLALARAFRDSTEVARNLCHLVGSAPIATDLVEANPDLVPRLDDSERLRTQDHESLRTNALATVGWRTDLDDQQAALRRWMRRNLFGIVARDLLDLSTADDVAADLSSVADVVVSVAVELLEPKVPFAVIGLGRLGGQELSYGSDLDLVFVHAGAGPEDAAEAERVAAGVLRLVGGRTPSQRIFEVDLDLRPEGKQGSLARSLDSYNIYLDRWSAVWERQALLKARAVAGSPEAISGFRGLLDRHVWHRTPSRDDIREIRRIKARIEAERMPPSIDPRMHLKLGPGAIVDVEFTAQLLQWERGEHIGSTRACLHRMVELGAIERSDRDVLVDALDTCNRLRARRWLVCGPGDALPSLPDQRMRLARSLHRSVTDLTEHHLRVTRRARTVVERVFYGEG